MSQETNESPSSVSTWLERNKEQCELVKFPEIKGHPYGNMYQLLLLSGVLASSGLYQTQFATATQIATVILMGRELGLSALRSLQDIAINATTGKTTLSIHAMHAMVLATGSVEKYEERHTGDGEDSACTIVMCRKGVEGEFTATFSQHDAARAGLNNKQIWKAYGKDMRRARALARVHRMGWADVIGGTYCPEELMHEIDDAASNKTQAGRPSVAELAMLAVTRAAQKTGTKGDADAGTEDQGQ